MSPETDCPGLGTAPTGQAHRSGPAYDDGGRAIFEGIEQGYYETDLSGSFSFSNDSTCLILGYSRDELARLNLLRDCLDAETAKGAGDALKRVRITGVPLRDLGWKLVRKDGTSRLVRASIFLRRTARGRPTGFQGLLNDNRDREVVETGRRQLEEQIRHAQKLESLGVLAEGLAHDFNNLLMGLLGNADRALAALPSDSPVRHNLERIQETGTRASELTRQMLAYSGKTRVVTRPVNLTALVKEMTPFLNGSVSKKVPPEYDLAEDLFDVAGDPAQLRQVITALVANASEALGREKDAITIRTGQMGVDRSYLADAYLRENLSEGPYAYVEVMDTGRGMDEETRTRMFDPFFSTKFLGRGLGLAAVLGIVRSHGGAIKVHSEPGAGSTFRVLFPSSRLHETSIVERQKELFD